MNAECLIGIDIGTHSSKTIVFDIDGNALESVEINYEVNNPKPGWFEQNAKDWYDSIINSFRQIEDKKPGILSCVKAIGISAQSDAVVPIDRKGNIVYPATIYLDKRSSEICLNIHEKEEARCFVSICGNDLGPSHFAPRIKWLKINKPDIYKKVWKFLTANSYIIFCMTNEASFDVTQGGFSSIFDVEHADWSDKLISIIDIDKDKLPEIYNSSEIVGKLTKKFAQISGLPFGISVVAGAMDFASSMFATGSGDQGDAFIEIGTVIPLGLITNKPIYQDKLMLFNSVDPKKFILGGAVDSGGNCIEWFKREFFINKKLESNNTGREFYETMEQDLLKTLPGAGGLLFLPYLAGMRHPKIETEISGILAGLSINTTRIQIFRAVLEGTAYGMKFILSEMEKFNFEVNEISLSGGGSRSMIWNQIFSDVLGKKIRMPFASGAALGSAMLAGIGVNYYTNFMDAINKVVKIKKYYYPDSSNNKLYEEYYNIFISVLMETIKDLKTLNKLKILSV